MHHRSMTYLGAFGLAGLLVACGTSTGGSTPDGGGAADATGSDTGPGKTDGGTKKDSGTGEGGAPEGGSSGEGGGGNDGGGACGAPDASFGDGGKSGSGLVLLSEATMPAPTAFSVLGDFSPGDVVSDACGGTMVGACCFGNPTGKVHLPLTAGTLTVTDGAKTLASLASPYVASSMSTATLTWKPGDTLLVAATGGGIDAFSISVGTPELLTGISPSLSASLAVSTSADLIVSWDPGAESCSKITFGLSQGAGMPNIGCVADDSAGTLTVPKALLGMLTVTDGTAVMQRLEPAYAVSTHDVVEVLAAQVIETKSTYSP
jgi:hypothetical protein